MRTRTLLLLAVGCGVAILAAGVALFWRIGEQQDATAPREIGEPVSVADLTVVVVDAEREGDRLFVTIEVGGVEDPDGTAAFRLVVPGVAIPPGPFEPPVGGPPRCGATTEVPVECVLGFDLGDVADAARVLVLSRGEERVRWQLP